LDFLELTSTFLRKSVCLIVEIMYMDFPIGDQVVNQDAKNPYTFDGRASVLMVTCIEGAPDTPSPLTTESRIVAETLLGLSTASAA
jgi:hypothetical protein